MSRKPNLKVRDHILGVAHVLIFKNGFKGISMDDIASEAGIKKANLFHYYPTKEVLGLAVFDYAVREAQEEMGAGYAEDIDPEQMITKMFDGASQGMQKSGCSGGCFIGNMAIELSDYNENFRHKVASYMHIWRQRLTDFLDRWRSKGYFKADLRTEEAAQGILSLFEGAMLISKATKTVDALKSSKEVALQYLRVFQI